MAEIMVSLTNETAGHIFSEWSEPVEDWLTRDDGSPDLGAIYRLSQQEYGVCRSSVYVDPAAGGPPRKVGWYFESRQRYEDTNEPYLRGAWVTVRYQVGGES
jgi:hypothetical protein